MRVIGCAALLFAAGSLEAQSLAARVTQTDGTVQVIYPSRPDVCGDGVGMLIFGHTRYNRGYGYDEGRGRCVAGPARVVATVMSGEVTRLRTYVGPVRPSDARTIEVSAADAEGWLKQLIASSAQRVAQDAMLPLVIADAQDPSPALLAVARDDNRPTGVRRTAL